MAGSVTEILNEACGKETVAAAIDEELNTLYLAALGDQVTHDALIQEIELYNRLDSRIERLLKRLFQLKTAKQMCGLEGTSSEKTALPKLDAMSAVDA
jgi:hypothetical protein